MAEVPEDIVRWFGGEGILAERHNLQRVAARFRVVQVTANIGDADEPWIVKGEWREFKSYNAAVKLRDEWARAGHIVLLQTGMTWWLDADELPNYKPDETRQAPAQIEAP